MKIKVRNLQGDVRILEGERAKKMFGILVQTYIAVDAFFAGIEFVYEGLYFSFIED